MTINVMLIILLPIFNYFSYCFTTYLDHRYKLGIGDSDDPMKLPTILICGCLPLLFLPLYFSCWGLFIVGSKIHKNINLHKDVVNIAIKQRKQANDIDFQAEKYLLDKK